MTHGGSSVPIPTRPENIPTRHQKPIAFKPYMTSESSHGRNSSQLLPLSNRSGLGTVRTVEQAVTPKIIERSEVDSTRSSHNMTQHSFKPEISKMHGEISAL